MSNLDTFIDHWCESLSRGADLGGVGVEVFESCHLTRAQADRIIAALPPESVVPHRERAVAIINERVRSAPTRLP